MSILKKLALGGAAVAATVIPTTLVTQAPADAASITTTNVSACFKYLGYGWTYPVMVEYYNEAQRRWVWFDTVNTPKADGCVSYSAQDGYCWRFEVYHDMNPSTLVTERYVGGPTSYHCAGPYHSYNLGTYNVTYFGRSWN